MLCWQCRSSARQIGFVNHCIPPTDCQTPDKTNESMKAFGVTAWRRPRSSYNFNKVVSGAAIGTPGAELSPALCSLTNIVLWDEFQMVNRVVILDGQQVCMNHLKLF